MIQVETGTMIVSGRSDWPITGEERRRREMRMMSICLTCFPISGLGETKLYQNLVWITRKWGFYLVSWSGRESILPWNKVTIPFIS